MKLWRKFKLLTLTGILFVNIVIILMMVCSTWISHVSPARFPTLSILVYAFPLLLIVNVSFLVFWLVFQKWKAALFPIVGLFLCWGSISCFMPLHVFESVPSSKHTISVLSYNVMRFGLYKKENGQSDILQYLKDSEADIICLQEYAVSTNKRKVTQKDVDKYLAGWPYRSIVSVGKKSSQKLACFSKFPILSSVKIDYSSKANGSVAYQILSGEDTLLVVNNHLESNKLTLNDKQKFEDTILQHVETKQVRDNVFYLARRISKANALRAVQADSVSAFVRRSSCKYKIVCGDFNDIPVSYTHRVMARGLKDAFAESGFGFGISYHHNYFFFHIDNMLVSRNLCSYNCHVDNSIKDSDHYPIRSLLVKQP